MATGKFITFDGGEGVGKSTQVQRLAGGGDMALMREQVRGLAPDPALVHAADRRRADAGVVCNSMLERDMDPDSIAIRAHGDRRLIGGGG